MNILLTSIGQHVYMVKSFKEALGDKGLLHVANASPMTGAFIYADHHVVAPRSYEDNYIPFIMDYCITNDIKVIVPFMDIDLKPLSDNRDRFAEKGITVAVAGEEFIRVCSDKYLTYKFLSENGIRTPVTFLSTEEALAALSSGSVSYPLFVKARFGSGSMGLHVVHSDSELFEAYELCAQTVQSTHMKFATGEESPVIIQEFLNGDEYGIDIFNGLDGNHRNAVVKRKFGMSGGETSAAEVVDNPEMRDIATAIGKLSGHRGNMDCDFFLVDGDVYVLEMNPRFGGGYPFSHMAGCDLPGAIVKWALGEPVDDCMLTAEVGAISMKHMDLTRIK